MAIHDAAQGPRASPQSMTSPCRRGVGYVYVAETTPNRIALAANPPSLEGQLISTLHESLIANHLQGMETLAVAPDGHEYAVGGGRARLNR